MTREEYERHVAFLKRNDRASMITVDTLTGLPVCAHYMRDEGDEGFGFVVEWYGEPTHEHRMMEERLRARMMLNEIGAQIDAKQNGQWPTARHQEDRDAE